MSILSTNVVGKLFASLVASGQYVVTITGVKAIDDVALIDAHRSRMARSVHYDLSDQNDGGVIKKSLRAFLKVMK